MNLNPPAPPPAPPAPPPPPPAIIKNSPVTAALGLKLAVVVNS